MMRALLRALQRPERDRAARAIAGSLVEAARALVARADVQKWRGAAREQLIAEVREQAAREPAAGEVRVRAYRADLAPAGHAHALADHRGEPAVLEDPEVAAELRRARAEVMRIDERGELDHGGALVIERDDG